MNALRILRVDERDPATGNGDCLVPRHLLERRVGADEGVGRDRQIRRRGGPDLDVRREVADVDVAVRSAAQLVEIARLRAGPVDGLRVNVVQRAGERQQPRGRKANRLDDRNCLRRRLGAPAVPRSARRRRPQSRAARPHCRSEPRGGAATGPPQAQGADGARCCRMFSKRWPQLNGSQLSQSAAPP